VSAYILFVNECESSFVDLFLLIEA
jgi:hypothetical protein